MNKKLIFGFIAVVVAIAGWLAFIWLNHALSERSETFTAYTHVVKIEKTSVWYNGKEKVVEQDNPDYTRLANLLLSTLKKVNLQAKCAVFDEDVELLKRQGKIVEVDFKKPVNTTISQWIKPEDRDYILTDENGYRVLTNVQKVVFVLEGRYKGHILTKSANIKSYGCWAIKKQGNNEIDKTWIEKVNNILGGLRLSKFLRNFV